MNQHAQIIKCKLNSKGEKITDIQNLHKSLSFKEAYHLTEFYNRIDGLELRLSKFDIGPIKYTLHSWSSDIDHVMMSAIYHLEQTKPLGQFKDDRAEFNSAWQSKQYDLDQPLVIPEIYVEELEVISELKENAIKSISRC